jgi:hypothetical protein
VDLDINTVEISKSHLEAPQSVGLLWTRDQLVAELYLTTHNIHKSQASMRPAEFEPAIPAIERPQTHALDLAATGIDLFTIIQTHIWELSELFE